MKPCMIFPAALCRLIGMLPGKPKKSLTSREFHDQLYRKYVRAQSIRRENSVSLHQISGISCHLNIIELKMYVCGQNRRLCSRPHSHESVIFFVFLPFVVLPLRPLC